MKRTVNITVSTLAFCLLLAAAPRAAAQTGPGLMLVPFANETTHHESDLTTLLFPEGETNGPAINGSAPDASLYTIHYTMRTVITPNRDMLRLGVDMLHIEIDSNDSALPERLADHSIAAGVGLGRSEDGWEFALTAGVGFAGDLPFADSDATYLLGSLIAVKRVDEDTAWQFGIEHNGNRVIFPDVPLPFLAYSDTLSPEISYTVGFPYNALRWTPDDLWTITISATPAAILSAGFTADVDFKVTEGLHLYGRYDTSLRGFHLSTDLEYRRLFLSQRTIEVGVRARLLNDGPLQGQLTLAGGYGFDREFERGYDARDMVTVRELSDEPFVRLGIELAF